MHTLVHTHTRALRVSGWVLRDNKVNGYAGFNRFLIDDENVCARCMASIDREKNLNHIMHVSI